MSDCNCVLNVRLKPLQSAGSLGQHDQDIALSAEVVQQDII